MPSCSLPWARVTRTPSSFDPPRPTHQDQVCLQLFSLLVPLLGAPTAQAGLNHLPLEQVARIWPLFQENLYQSNLLRHRQQPRPPQQQQ